MTWVSATLRFVVHLAERHRRLFVAASIVVWTLLSRWRSRLAGSVADRSAPGTGQEPAAKRDRRVTRLLRWYPAVWRARYGDEMAALLHDTIAHGRDGPLLSLNVAKESLSVRLAQPERRLGLAGPRHRGEGGDGLLLVRAAPAEQGWTFEQINHGSLLSKVT